MQRLRVAADLGVRVAMRDVPWRGLLGLLLASGVLALVALPAAAGSRGGGEVELAAVGLEAQSPDPVPVQSNPEPPLEPVPRADCGPGSRPETGIQGRVSAEDHASGRAAEGFTCNTELVGSYTVPNAQGPVGGFKVLRYVDDAGRECAYYDTTLLFPFNVFDGEAGVNVLDMSDPANPRLATRLLTPAMLSPHESLALSEERGLLAAVLGNPLFGPGVVDVYDISADCRAPRHLATSPAGILGHESGMAPDGRTFYAGSAGGNTLVAVDLDNPEAPVPIWAGLYSSHGLSISKDGDRAYVATTAGALGGQNGLVILDTSEVQARVPNPTVREVSRLEWESMSIPQYAIPVTIEDHPYVVEIDEYGSQSEVGAGRIIDIGDETEPRVISNFRLEVHQPESFAAQADDPGEGNPVGGYSGHYCNVPQRADPGIVACSMNLSGLRVFDIRDPHRPREIAYFNAPVSPSSVFPGPSNWAQSMPAFASERGEIWYTDGLTGFYALRVTNDVWPFREDGDEPADREPPEREDREDREPRADADPGEDDERAAAPPADRSAAAGDLPRPASADRGRLPFTGFVLGALAALGLALLTLGIASRLRGRAE